ncbi:DUF6473 family protein [Flavimaricola marinus]|uniref:DUF6473 domain-containing protein n=1 Tax=Flavimaricola marinus TaxID=1819565 RepID=A0A238LBI4_9RHOB|nr:DUF6473 family protein [Flavimaricola marinus]SMY06765.1 hypothetical protein LOM8899_00895 [Flavimaricola marinus]
MKHETLDSAGISYGTCRYGNSKLFFRGPKKSLEGKYLTFIGGTETYGKFIPRPFPQMIEDMMGTTCVNFGAVNASIDAFLHETVVQNAAKKAEVNVVQVMGAHNMSNRFYTVHPRRNDRFVRASSVLRAIYPEVDFTEVCFTRHLLTRLYKVSPERFEIIREELQQAWRARMKGFLQDVGKNTLLLWFSDHLPTDAHWADRPDPLSSDPLFITRSMIDELRPIVRSVVLVQPSAKARANNTTDMIVPEGQAVAAKAMLGVRAHKEAAEALTQSIRSGF